MKGRTLKALNLVGGIDRVIGRGEKVFIKPNLVDGAPFETGEVVQLEVAEVLVEEAFRAGASEVIIGETPTVSKKTETMEAYDRMATRLEAKFLDLCQHPFVEVKVKDPILFSEVRISKPLLDSDVFIDVPTLKTHSRCGITLAIKNMYGLISREDMRLYHGLNMIEEAMLDLYQVRKADLIVADGTYTTFHIGPRPLKDFGETFRLDITLAGFDPISVDAVGAKILGIDPKTLRYLKWAEEKGLGTRNLDEIKVLGTSIEEAYVKNAADTAEFINARAKNIKVLNYDACTGCLGIPSETLTFAERALKDKIFLVMGPGANAAKVASDTEGEGTIILCGHCAAPTFYNELQGDFVPGCPPALEDLLKKLRELSVKSYKT